MNYLNSSKLTVFLSHVLNQSSAASNLDSSYLVKQTLNLNSTVHTEDLVLFLLLCKTIGHFTLGVISPLRYTISKQHCSDLAYQVKLKFKKRAESKKI